ncbi:MAG TPA: hypothetical protein VN726_14225 [Hanamia sp.]|nr:hypothetical protein [Hanamia sp.]
MIEIIVLVFLTIEIGKLAREKGLKPLTWRIYNVVGYIAAEFFGAMIGIMIFGKNNIISVMLVGLMFAISSYFIIKAQLNKLPDHDLDDDINNLGN